MAIKSTATILLATDLSASAGAATEEALRLARRLGAGLLILSAIDPGAMRLPNGRFRRRVDQERELRDWLYGDRAPDDSDSLSSLLAAAAADVEELYGVRVELASSGDCPADEGIGALGLAAREAMTNSAKYSDAELVDVYSEVSDDRVSVFVRDRGVGFDPTTVTADHRGISDSIVGRMQRAGGTATVTSAPGDGTEVELSLTRSTP